jgi:hypothetical protein
MSNQFEVFHGTDGDNILSIIRDGSMRPDSNHEIYYSIWFEDVLAHGADSKRKAAFGFKARIQLPAGASQRRESRSGNPIAIIVTTALPLPTEILELYVRPANATSIEIVRGIEAIKGHLLRY